MTKLVVQLYKWGRRSRECDHMADGRSMLFNATSNNVSGISWRSGLLVEETGVSRKKQPTCRK
jgi:hypothetical protein